MNRVVDKYVGHVADYTGVMAKSEAMCDQVANEKKKTNFERHHALSRHILPYTACVLPSHRQHSSHNSRPVHDIECSPK